MTARARLTGTGAALLNGLCPVGILGFLFVAVFEGVSVAAARMRLWSIPQPTAKLLRWPPRATS